MAGKVFWKAHSKRARVYAQLLAHLTSPDRAPGERLASVQRLAELYSTSVFTIHQALEELQAAGYVEMRHGAGTFVTSRHRPLTMADTVVLCMEAQGHLWADLAGMLMTRLSSRQRLATLMQPVAGGQIEEMGRRLAHSDAQTVIVRGGLHFPFDLLQHPAFRRKTVIAVVNWGTPEVWPGLYRVLSDGEAGGRLLSEFLWRAGHRRVLLVGTPNQVETLPTGLPHDQAPGPAFIRDWTARGGQWHALASNPDDTPYVQLDVPRFLRVFKSKAQAPTAIFGLRDVEAWTAQDLLLRERPDLAASVEIAGFGDTPWSQAGHPPFTTLNLDLERIADAALAILDAVLAGTPPATDLLLIPPRLIPRGPAAARITIGLRELPYE